MINANAPLQYLQVSYINDGLGASDIYPRGPDVDGTHGEADYCIWSWKTGQKASGLCFVKCKTCGANIQAVLSAGAGSMPMACRAGGAWFPGMAGP